MKPTEVLNFLTTRGVEIIREDFTARSCILSTRVAVEVLRSLGAPAYPVAVKLDVANEPAQRAMLEGWGNDRARVFREGAKWIAVECSGVLDRETHEWDGHLVACHPGPERSTVLVDLTLDQMSRPMYGINLKPWWTLAREWPVVVVDDERGLVLQYRKTDVRSYREARDWTVEDRWRPMVDRILAELSSRDDTVPGPR